MKKRDKIIIIAVLSVILLVVGVNVAKKVIRERNVFSAAMLRSRMTEQTTSGC